MAHGAIDFDDPTRAHVLETYRIVPPDVVQSHKDEARAHPRTGDRRHGSSIESGDGGRFMTNSTMGSSSGMGTIIACKSAAPFPPPAPPFASRDGERTAGAAGGNDGGSRCWEREMEGAVRPAAVAVADAPCHRRAMVLATPLAEGPARTGRSGRCRDVVSLALPPPRLRRRRPAVVPSAKALLAGCADVQSPRPQRWAMAGRTSIQPIDGKLIPKR